MTDLEIKDLHASIDGTEILKGVNLQCSKGEVNALMGPNGSGKSTLAHCLMGHPNYEITKGKILFKDKDITEMKPDERARLGLFLSFQYPIEVPGLSVANFLRTAVNAMRDKPLPVPAFMKELQEKLKALKMDKRFAQRYLNEGFSGGEKKRAEILQMAVLQPEMAILDETDSGLDISALKTVGEGVTSLMNSNLGILIITHYQRILNYIKPDHVHIMVSGQIIQSGGPELAVKLEKEGYDWINNE